MDTPDTLYQPVRVGCPGPAGNVLHEGGSVSGGAVAVALSTPCPDACQEDAHAGRGLASGRVEVRVARRSLGELDVGPRIYGAPWKAVSKPVPGRSIVYSLSSSAGTGSPVICC